MGMLKSTLLLCLLLLSAHSIFAQVPILVQERAGIARTAEPVTLGIPFAEGELQPAASLHINDPNGNPVDAQFKPMSVWGDGSIRWLKCDFQATVNANSTAQYNLVSGSHVPSTQLTAIETPSAITVTTGPLRFEVSKTAFNWFNQAWLDLNNDGTYENSERIISSGSAGPVVRAGGVNYPANAIPPDDIAIEEQGPMKVVIRIAGRHFDGSNNVLKYETRIYAFAGKPFVRIYHVYANGKSVGTLAFPLDPVNNANFERYAIDLNLNLNGSKTVRFGGQNGNEISFPLSPSQTGSVIQADRNTHATPLAYTIARDGNTQDTGARAEGWGDISDQQWGLLISSRHFWQKYPKGLTLRDNGTISIEPAPTPEILYIGMGTGDEYLLYFHPASEASQSRVRAMSMNKAPLLARTTPAQYSSSKAFYTLSSGLSSRYPQMNNYVNETTGNHLSGIASLYLGTKNFGAVPHYDFGWNPGNIDGTGWGGNYYDGSVSTALRLYAETGNPAHYDVFLPAARHFMESVCWNTYDPNDWMNGYNPAYSDYHRFTAHFEHHYGEGIWYYYYLTGDERAREIGLRAANSIMNQQFWGNNNVNCRMAYQRGSAVLEAYKNTRNPAYLNHARHLLITKILDTQDAYGVIGSTDESGNIGGESVFMMGLYSDTLWKYIQELPTGDPQRQVLINKLVLIADFFHLYARKNPGVEDYWNSFGPPPHNSPPEHQGDEGNPDSTVYWNGRGTMAGTYAYAYELTGNSHYLNLATNILDDLWFNGTRGDDDGRYFWSKVSGQAMKNMLHAVAIVEGDGTGGGPLYSDHFDDLDASDWTPNRGTWNASNGSLVGSHNRKADNISPFGGCTSCTFEADVAVETANGRASLLAWYQSSRNSVEFIAMADKNKWVLKQRANGLVVAKGKVLRPILTGVSYRVRISYDGNNLRVAIDGQDALTIPTSFTPTGTVGVRIKSVSKNTVSASFDNIDVGN